MDLVALFFAVILALAALAWFASARVVRRTGLLRFGRRLGGPLQFLLLFASQLLLALRIFFRLAVLFLPLLLEIVVGLSWQMGSG